MDLKRSNYLPILQAIDPQRPQSGYMQRSMNEGSSTDGGIVERIMFAAQKGYIHPQVVQYLMENLLQDDQASNQEISRMPSAPNQPNQMDVVKKGLLDY